MRLVHIAKGSMIQVYRNLDTDKKIARVLLDAKKRSAEEIKQAWSQLDDNHNLGNL